nr:15048_t:CDS:1 [Entrophospora candida]
MVTRLHQTFYRSNATQLSESDIKEIRDSRGKVPSASKKMAEKFHIGTRRVYEIWKYTERLQQDLKHASFSADESQDIEASVIKSSIKKKSSKSRTKSVLCNNEPRSHISDSIPTNNSTEKISSEDLGALYEKEARRDEKNKANMTRLLATTNL